MAFDDRVLRMTPADVVRYFEQSPDLRSMAGDVRKSLLPDGEELTPEPEATDYPPRWAELSDEQKAQVNKWIDLQLAAQPALPMVEKPGKEVVDWRIVGNVSYQLEKVKCGKDCKGCPHGPYWYGYYRGKTGKVVSKYIGKDFKRLM